MLCVVAVPLLFGSLAGSAQTWTPTIAPSMDWRSLASSADGSRLLAGGPSALYLSTNSGANWATNNIPAHDWACVASSADGNLLAAAVGFSGTGGIYFSTNGGGSWAPSLAPLKQWRQLAMSADGTKIVALPVTGTPYYLSMDSGSTWTTNTPPASFGTIALSADGSHWAANHGNGGIFVSTDMANSWASNNVNVSPFDAPSLAFSADGNTQVAAQGGNGGLICISTNLGVSWNTNTVHNVWLSTAASADGQRLVTVGYSFIYTSADSGQTWVSNSAPKLSEWSAVAGSADGHAVVAAGFPGGIYILKTTPSPSLNINLTPSNGNLGLSWIVPSTNVVLQQSSDLAGWSNVTNVPSLNPSNVQNQVTIPLSNSFGFYRLATP